nr:DUF2357 domain-containing protein [Acholeplasmatales bacterium]
MRDKRLDNYYLPINQFIKDHNKISYIEFDYDIVHKLNLFIYNDSIDFDKLEEEITKIEKSLPAIKRIFQKPIIRLSDTSEVLPVEAVRTVDNQTLSHIQNHSELWSDIKSNNIRPNKLLTRTYYDNYAIYENIAFKKCIDLILQFCRNNMHLLKELIYSSDVLDVNLLERVNHLNYFLALGKLHTSYIRDFSKYYSVSSQIINRLEEINKVVKARLKRPVYRMNKKYKGRFSLHQTNILYMDKNYKKVYSLLKGFKAKDYGVDDLILDDKKLNDDYFNYALVLLIFSIGHF